MAYNFVNVLFIFSLFALIQTGTALRCYNCSSKDMPGQCGNYINFNYEQPQQLECSAGEQCIKYKPPVIGGGSDIVERGCYKNMVCNGPLSFCYMCDDKDLCNTSNVAVPSFIALFLVALVYFARYCNA